MFCNLHIHNKKEKISNHRYYVGGEIDYTGEVIVLLYNHGNMEYNISVGDAIAQLILEKISTLDVVEITEMPKRKNNQRGDQGLGFKSTKQIITNTIEKAYQNY